jgi:hypothetical protein
MARYQALCDLWLPGCQYAQAGDVLSDIPSAGTIPIPVGWIPSRACEPLDTLAAQAYWNAGPAGMADAQPNLPLFLNGARWTGRPVTPPSCYWVRAGTLNSAGFVLTGIGASLGVHPTI